jgi:hypothetical protein
MITIHDDAQMLVGPALGASQDDHGDRVDVDFIP